MAGEGKKTARESIRAQVAEHRIPRALGYGDLATSLILMFPLFLAYQIGAVFSSSVNGVDFVTRLMLAAVDYDRAYYLVVQLSLAALFLIVVACARRRALWSSSAMPVMLESAIYALTLGAVIVLFMQELLGFAVPLGSEIASGEFAGGELDSMALGPTGEAIVVALGAGVYEELVFRLGFMAGSTALLLRAGIGHRSAVVMALVLSALLFSLAHHLGPYGEALALDVFIYRALAGVVFGLVFYFRSLAHAAYTHCLYDLYVLVIHP